MAYEIILMKSTNGALIPADLDSSQKIAMMKVGNGFKATITQYRNLGFHKKYFAMLNLAYETWEPACKEYKGQPVAKNFDQFRNDITILAGHYDTSINFKGDVRLNAKSISFANMSQDQFDALYSSTVDVILSRVLTQYTREDLDSVVEQILGFT